MITSLWGRHWIPAATPRGWGHQQETCWKSCRSWRDNFTSKKCTFPFLKCGIDRLPIQDDVISEAEFVVEKVAKVFSVHRRFPVDLKTSSKFDLIRLVQPFSVGDCHLLFGLNWSFQLTAAQAYQSHSCSSLLWLLRNLVALNTWVASL